MKVKTPEAKRKSMKQAATPTPATKAAATPINSNTPKKKPFVAAPVSPVKKQEPQAAKLTKIDDKSKAIKKNGVAPPAPGGGPKGKNANANSPAKGGKNKKPNKGNMNKPKGPGAGPRPQQQSQNDGNKKKKNRYQRMQNKLNAKPRSPLSCMRALKAEEELNKAGGRVFSVRLPDPELSITTIRTWSSSIENALFPKPVEPRSFLLVLKPGSNMKKEVEALRKISFGNGKLIVEEKHDAVSYDGDKSADLIDPYSLYVTNLDESVARDDLKALFPKAKTFMNPRKHNPKTGSTTKFAFVSFDSAEDALEGFKTVFNKVFKGDKAVVARFRRIGRQEVANQKKEQEEKAKPAKVAAQPAAAAKPAVAKEAKKQQKVIKQEPMEEDDDDEEDDEDEMESDDDESPLGAEQDEDDESEDDEDDGLGDEDDDEDEDEDDDDDE